jgi:hypothetical protein
VTAVALTDVLLVLNISDDNFYVVVQTSALVNVCVCVCVRVHSLIVTNHGRLQVKCVPVNPYNLADARAELEDTIDVWRIHIFPVAGGIRGRAKRAVAARLSR